MSDPAAVAQLAGQGFAVLPFRVEAGLVAAALRRINQDLGRNGIDPAKLDRFRNKTFCPGILDAPEIAALTGGPVEAFVRALVGPYETGEAQIALRFPGDAGVPHIDGFYDDPVAEADTPNAVLGVYLSEVGPGDGAFAVWPDHVATIERWAAALPAAPRRDARLPVAGLDPASGQPVTGPMGTAFLCHGLLPHMNALHRGPGIRYAVFRRCYAPRYAGRDVWAMLKDRRLTLACLKGR
jgi:hypothetical protein